MENHNEEINQDPITKEENPVIEEITNENTQSNTGSEEEKWKREFNEMKEKYMRLYADFENFRKRTAKEKLEFMTSANEGLIKSILPVLDDFERAQKNIGNQNVETMKQGVTLIHDKLFKILEHKGLKPMVDVVGSEFNADYHEAITQIPMPDMQGKIVDELEKGYFLGEKVLRYSKVVVGS
ncbi:MAG: nucleotide exchange factor GrpE [Thermoflexibacter sp.]|jgi:molecular chaperone GrpE|nr:nucleotide exchange factor GrpE [Thermoflexibacter sp.]